MEPSLKIAPELDAIVAELSRREPIFDRPEFGTTRTDFERMTAEEFWETGASGRRYSRQLVLDELEKRFAAPVCVFSLGMIFSSFQQGWPCDGALAQGNP